MADKGKSAKGGSGSSNDKRGGIAKAKESAQRAGGERSGGDRQGERAESQKGGGGQRKDK